jgi:hypothetical protein
MPLSALSDAFQGGKNSRSDIRLRRGHLPGDLLPVFTARRSRPRERGAGVERAGRRWRAGSLHRIEDRTNHALFGDERDDLHHAAAPRTDKRIHFVDVADQVCPALAGGLALGGVRLGRDRRGEAPVAIAPPDPFENSPAAATSLLRLARAAFAYHP